MLAKPGAGSHIHPIGGSESRYKVCDQMAGSGATRRIVRFLLPGVVVFFAMAGLAGVTPAIGQIQGYTVTLGEISDKSLREAILSVSQLEEGKDRPSPTLRALRLRVEAGVERVEKLLRSRGYYRSNITYRIERPDPANAEVVLNVDSGPPYRLAAFDIVSTTPGEPRTPIDVSYEMLGIDTAKPLQAEQVIAADSRLLATLAKQGYPLARILERKTVVDHQSQSVRIAVSLDMARFARFGATAVDGVSTVEKEYVLRYQSWGQGERFDAGKLEETRAKLRETGLFTSVLIKHATAPDDTGELPVTISVVERKHRSLGAGGSFSTTEGLLATAFWEHRNLMGHGERLRLDAEVGEIRQGLFGNFRIPEFMVDNQDIVIDARIAQEEPDGFTSQDVAAVARLERRFGKVYSASGGVGFEHSLVDENGVEADFSFLVLPLILRHDSSDDVLDPGRGHRDTLAITPNIGILDTDTTFVSTRLFNSIYLPLAEKKKLVLAGWLRLGTIVGEETPDVPANKRLYAGGPGSVRGYSLNSIGPLDSQNDPIGGRSLTEFGAELRWRAFESIGFVAFVEAGGVYDDNVPEFGKDLQWGGGIGGRYLTAVGPIRFDVAVPLNRRNGVDDAFQILVSLGQAF